MDEEEKGTTPKANGGKASGHVGKYFQRLKQATTIDNILHQSSETAMLPAKTCYILPEQAIHNEEETMQTNT